MLVARMGSGWVLVVCVALCIGLVSAQHNHAHKYATPASSLLTPSRHEEEHTEDDGHAHEPHIRVKRKVNITGLREECRPDPRCRPCASFERTELFCLRTGFKQQLTCSVDGKVVRIGYEACDSDSNVSALRFLGVCSLVLAGSALLVHLRKKCIIREHLQKLEAMSNV